MVWIAEKMNNDEAGEETGQRHRCPAKNLGVYPRSFKQDNESTRCPIQILSLSSESNQCTSLGKVDYSGTQEEKKNRILQPWFGFLCLTNHSVGPQIQSGILWKVFI